MKWIILGGSGFIGRNLVSELLRHGENVLVVDKRRPVGEEFAETAYLRLDFRLAQEQVLCGHVRKDDVVVHLAALSGIAQCDANLWESYAVNVSMTYAALLEAEAAKAASFVFASSGAVLAGHGGAEHPLGLLSPAPIGVYGAQKAAAEDLCRGFGARRLRCVALRFSNVYGPYSEHKSSVVNAFVRGAIRGEMLEVHGDGTQRRDFIYVGDVVDAIIRAGRRGHLTTTARFDVVHISSGVTSQLYGSNGEVGIVQYLEEEIGRKICLKHSYEADPGVQYSCLDNSSALALLGWKPQHHIHSGIHKTIEWYRADPLKAQTLLDHFGTIS